MLRAYGFKCTDYDFGLGLRFRFRVLGLGTSMDHL